MAKSSGSSLSLPPFPPLQWDAFFWTGRIVLSSWRGFQRRLGAYASRSSKAESDGTALLCVVPRERVAEGLPSSAQVNAFRYFLEHEEAIHDALVAAIFEEYPTIRRNRLGDGFVEEAEMPVLERPEQLKSYIGLSTLHVLPVVKNDVAYLGFEFGCTWDEEHGLGAMMHQDRILEYPEMGIGKINGADIASEEWMAEADKELSD